nr:uncharacterized protein LOC113693155 [Coffea arabica]
MAVCERFGEGDPEEAIDEFNKLMQTGSVTEYLEKFEQLKSMVMLSLPGQLDSYYKLCFLSGLKEEIVSMVRITRPLTLADTIEAAKLQERNLEAIRKTQGKMMHKYSPSPSSPPINKQNFTPHTKMKWPNFQYKKLEHVFSRNAKTGTHAVDQFRKITPSELSYRREKGLCFKCAKPYTLGHVCKQAHLNYILIDDPWGVRESLDEPGKDTEEFWGTEHKTLKLRGKIAGREIIILVDSGSTHCFIDERLAKTIQLPAIGNPLTVRVANGELLESRQLQGALQWEMQGNKFTHQFNTLKLGSCHMVLGVDWLARYSPIEFDFKQLSMRFLQGSQPVELKGEVSELKLKAIRGSKLAKWRRKQAYGITAQLYVMEEEKEDTEVIPAEMKDLLNRFEGVFAEPQGIPPRRSHDNSILLKEGATPFQVRPYRCLYVQKSEINRQLNELTLKDKFPMPLIDELLDESHGSKYFTKIDLRVGYHQIRVKVEDIHKTTFRTHQGLYEFKVMPFGLTNAPTTFQSLMNHIFRDQLRRYVLFFFYDILIYSPSLEVHLQQVAKVLNILQEHQLYAKRSKCSFTQTEVEYLGHIISGEGVRADPKKVDSMLKWPKAASVKELKGFLSLTGYYRKFVKGYGAIAKPLTILLKNDGFHWST